MSGRLALWSVMLAALLAGAAPAAAVTLPKDIAAQLRRSPLVVDRSLEEAVPPAQRRAVLRAIEAAPYPVWVVLVPVTPGDRYGGDARRFLGVIHGRLGRDGVYVTVSERLLTQAAFGVDDDEPDLNQASWVGNFESGVHAEPQIAKVRRFVEVLSAPDLAARYARTEARLRRQREKSAAPPPPPPAATDGGDEDGGNSWLLAVGVLAALGAAGALVHGRRRRHASPAPDDEPLIPARVFEHAHSAAAGDLREQIEQRLIAFADRIDRDGTPSDEAAQERQQQALDAYAAPRRVLSSEPRMVDLVGALVLVEDGSSALAAAEALEAGRRPPRAAPLCFFDPRHPGSTKRLKWKEHLNVPACAACRAALRTGHCPPDTLLDDGRPWFETDSLWARTGFGVLLAQRIGRGELRRRG